MNISNDIIRHIGNILLSLEHLHPFNGCHRDFVIGIRPLEYGEGGVGGWEGFLDSYLQKFSFSQTYIHISHLRVYPQNNSL